MIAIANQKLANRVTAAGDAPAKPTVWLIISDPEPTHQAPERLYAVSEA